MKQNSIRIPWLRASELQVCLTSRKKNKNSFKFICILNILVLHLFSETLKLKEMTVEKFRILIFALSCIFGTGALIGFVLGLVRHTLYPMTLALLVLQFVCVVILSIVKE